MEEMLRQLMGKTVDVNCGTGAIFRGEVAGVKDGVLFLRDEDETTAYIAIDKVMGVVESTESQSRPGFIV